jgi:8-oxo-dGTP diphosphatase
MIAKVERQLQGERMADSVMKRLKDVDWANWTPNDVATLCFVVRAGRILLIRKKRGLGAGKVNGPGGKLEAGETPLQCAVREVQEELGVTPLDLLSFGELRFQFADGYAIHVHAFRARDCEGEAVETEEAIPMWVDLGDIPYAEMWEDDELWLPMLIAGEHFTGRFLFDDDAMLDYTLAPSLKGDGSA